MLILNTSIHISNFLCAFNLISSCLDPFVKLYKHCLQIASVIIRIYSRRMRKNSWMLGNYCFVGLIKSIHILYVSLARNRDTQLCAISFPLLHAYQAVASTATELRMLPRICHPRLNRLIFSRHGLWESTCFISVLLALPEAPQLFGALRVCRVIFLKHTSTTWMNKRW